MSGLVRQVPLAGASADVVANPMQARPARPEIKILLPETTPEDVPVEAWILMPDSGSFAPDAEPLTASLKIEGPGRLDCKTVRLNEGAGRFFIAPTGQAEAQLGSRQCMHMRRR